MAIQVVGSGLREGGGRAAARDVEPRRNRPRRPPRRAYFGEEHGWIETPVLRRADLATSRRAGPLIVEEYDATCVVPPGAHAELDAAGNIVIEL